MRFAHLLSRITGTPWFITVDALESITTLVESRIYAIAASETAGARENPPRAPATAGTAVIPIQGVIGKRLSPMEMACGGCDVDAVQAQFDEANADSNVNRIILHVDSPGGTVTGVPELAQRIYREKRKEVLAVSDTLMGSAAYYIASAADEIAVTPTAQVGSIGTVLQVRETTSTNSADGRTRLRIFRSGADKAAGADAPLTEAQAAYAQELTDKLGATFRNDVVKARLNVDASSMTGLAYFGDEAVRRHLADRVVRNLADALTAR